MVNGGLRIVTAPPTGFYRVGRQPDPLAMHGSHAMDVGDHRAGNRFDSFTGTYQVLYFATEPETCFEETLARLVPRPKLADLVRDDWASMNFMNPGAVAREWRNDRRMIRVTVPDDSLFVDVDHPDSLAVLENAGRAGLLIFDVEELDTAVMRGSDRRVTRFLSELVWKSGDDGEPVFAGLRYASRVDGQECWAVFDRTPLATEEIRVIYQNDAALARVAKRRSLTIH